MLSEVVVLSVIVNVLLVGRLVKAFGERRAVMFGLACGTLGFLVYGLAGTGWMFMLGLPISAQDNDLSVKIPAAGCSDRRLRVYMP